MTIAIKPPCEEGVIHAGECAVPCNKNVGRWVIAATTLGSSIALIDGSVVNVALPVLQKALNASVTDVQWIVESYALFLSALILVGGSLGDFFGRRRIFAYGIILFALASMGCGLAIDVNQLIAARAVQGIGGALLVPGSLAIISASFSGESRGKAIGTWSGFTGITSALGPVLGGWLVEHTSWRWIFFINVPLAAIVLTILFWRVPESRNEAAKNLDWWGAILVTLGLGTLVFGLISASTLGLTAPLVLGCLAGGVITLGAFIFVERSSRAPMVPLLLFKSRTFSGANLLTLLLYFALSGVFYFFPFNLIQVQGYSATAAGAAFLPFILLMFLLSRWSGSLVSHYGAKLPLIVGPAIASIGFGLFSLPGIGGSYWTTFFPAIVILGLGMAISVAPLTTTVMSAVTVQQAGTASGINNAVARTAGLLAVAITNIFVANIFNSSLDRRLAAINLPLSAQQLLAEERIKLAGAAIPSGLSAEVSAQVKNAIALSFIDGFRLVIWMAVGLALLSAIVSLFTIKDRSKT